MNPNSNGTINKEQVIFNKKNGATLIGVALLFLSAILVMTAMWLTWNLCFGQ